MSGFGRTGGYGRSRDGGRDGDYGSGPSVDMYVPAGDCGKIIGRGGSKIRDLQDQFQCQIKVSRDDEGDGTRRVTLSGADDAVQMAMDEINQLLQSGDQRGGGGGGGRQQQSYGGGGGGGGGGYDEPFSGGSGGGGGAGAGSSKEDMQIDSSFVGRIIGKGGSRIRELQDETGCRINVSRDSTGKYGQTDIELVGSRSAIQHAKGLIEEITSQA